MKNTAVLRNEYPNAASRRYRMDKAIDYALTAAATIGLAAALLFLILI